MHALSMLRVAYHGMGMVSVTVIEMYHVMMYDQSLMDCMIMFYGDSTVSSHHLWTAWHWSQHIQGSS